MRIWSLVRLEARKIRIRNLILLDVPITAILLFSTFVSIFGVNQDHASSFAAIFKMMISLSVIGPVPGNITILIVLIEHDDHVYIFD